MFNKWKNFHTWKGSIWVARSKPYLAARFRERRSSSARQSSGESDGTLRRNDTISDVDSWLFINMLRDQWPGPPAPAR